MLEYEHFERSAAAGYIDRANDLAGRVSERRAFAIRANYAAVVENDLEVAAQVYRSAVDAYPDGADNYARLASVYSRIGRHEAAVEQYKEAIRVEPTMSIALDGLASEYLEKLGRVDLAIQWLRRQMSYHPQDVAATSARRQRSLSSHVPVSSLHSFDCPLPPARGRPENRRCRSSGHRAERCSGWPSA